MSYFDHTSWKWWGAAALATWCLGGAAQQPIQQFYTRNCPDCVDPRPRFRTNTEACLDLAREVLLRLGTSNECGPINVYQKICTGPVGNSWDWGVLSLDIYSTRNTGHCHPVGGNYSFIVQSEVVAVPLTIALSGASRTKALPAGPALPQTVTVKQGSALAVGAVVSISMSSGGSLGGVTDGTGTFEFLYVPPNMQAVTDTLTAACVGCSNSDTKQVEVEPCDCSND